MRVKLPLSYSDCVGNGIYKVYGGAVRDVEARALFRFDSMRVTRWRHCISGGCRYESWNSVVGSIRTVARDTDIDNVGRMRLYHRNVCDAVEVCKVSTDADHANKRYQRHKQKLNQKQTENGVNHDNITIRIDDRTEHGHQYNDASDQHRLQLQGRTDELIRQLRQSNITQDGGCNNDKPIKQQQHDRSWLMSQVHSIMFEWITLTPIPHTNTPRGMNRQEGAHKHSIGKTVESLLNAVINHHQQSHQPQAKRNTPVQANNQLIRPTIQMYKYTVEAYLQHLPQNKSSISSNLHNAERIFQNLCHLIKSSSSSLTNNDNLLWNKGGIQFSSNRDHDDVRGMVHGCFALLVHGILNEGGDGALSRAEQALVLLLNLHDGVSGDSTIPPLEHDIDVDNTDTLDIGRINLSNSEPSATSNNNTNPPSYKRWKHTPTSLNALLHILISKRDSNSLSHAHHILTNLLNNLPQQKLSSSSFAADGNKDDDNVLLPNRTTFNLLLHAYGNLGDVSTVSTLLQKFESLHQSSALAFGPDTASYNGLMDAYAKKGDRCSCDKAVALLEWMNSTTIDGGDVGGGGRRPDVVTYTATIHALSKNGRAREAHDLLLQTICSLQHYDGGEGGEGGRLAVRPDRVVFSAVVDAWAKSGEEGAVERCWEIVRAMIKLSTEEGGDRVGGGGGREKNQDLGPSMVTFNSLLYAIGNSGRTTNNTNSRNKNNNRNKHKHQGDHMNSMDHNKKDIGAKALEVLSYMEDLHRTHIHLNTKPNLTTYNTILSILGKAGKVDDARDFFRRMLPIPQHHTNDDIHDVTPITAVKADIVTVNTFLDTLSHPSAGPNAATEALTLLDNLTTQSSSTTTSEEDNSYCTAISLAPNTRTYNTVLNVLSKSNSERGRDRVNENRTGYQAVQRILNQMEANYASSLSSSDATTTTSIMAIPNAVTYATAIHFVARHHIPHKALIAFELLRRMERAYQSGNQRASPTTIAYNGVLNACCFVKRGEGEEALKTANETYWEMMEGGRDGCRPDHVTYATMVKVMARYMRESEGREEAIERIFVECRRRGRMSGFVLKELRNSVCKEVYLRLTKDL